MNLGMWFLLLLLAGILIDKRHKFKSMNTIPNVDLLDDVVFPNKERTIFAHNVEDEYGGAHHYKILNFNVDGYHMSTQEIQFVKINEDKSVTPGLQDEQLLLMLLDRTKKLNKRFPCAENEEMVSLYEQLLAVKKKRVENRIERGVFKKLEK